MGVQMPMPPLDINNYSLYKLIEKDAASSWEPLILGALGVMAPGEEERGGSLEWPVTLDWVTQGIQCRQGGSPEINLKRLATPDQGIQLGGELVTLEQLVTLDQAIQAREEGVLLTVKCLVSWFLE